MLCLISAMVGRMMRVAGMRKIVAHIRLVVGVAEIVYPRRGVGINVDDVRVYKVV